MSERLKVYHPRAPRYLLDASENTVLRFKGRQEPPESLGTEVLNISKTGLAFRYHGGKPPLVGEYITIQFQVPGRDQMACFAEVIRHDRDLVAVRFKDLSPSQRLNLQWGLQKSFTRLEEFRSWQKWKQNLVLLYHYSDVLGKMLFFAGLHGYAIFRFVLAAY